MSLFAFITPQSYIIFQAIHIVLDLIVLISEKGSEEKLSKYSEVLRVEST